MANAAKAAGLQHVIWSTLEDTRKWIPLSDNRMPTLQGKYKVPHFDAKGEVNHVFTDAGVPTTFLNTTFYWDNMYMFGMGPAKGQDGNYSITFPMGNHKLSGIAAEDIGGCAYGIFKKGKEMAGKTVGIAGEHLTGAQMAEKLSKALGIKCSYNAVTPEAYRGFGFPGAEDLGNMFQFYSDFEDYFVGARNIDATRALNPKLQSFDQWLEKNKRQVDPVVRGGKENPPAAHRPSWTGGVAARSRKCRVSDRTAQTGWLFQNNGLSNHPGASRHPSCPGGAMPLTRDSSSMLTPRAPSFRFHPGFHQSLSTAGARSELYFPDLGYCRPSIFIKAMSQSFSTR